MNIKKIMCVVALAGIAVAMAAPNSEVSKRRKKRRGLGTPGLEMVLAPAQGPRVKVVDQQKRVSPAVLKDAQWAWHKNVWMHSDYLEGGTREDAFADGGCGLAIFIVDKPGGETLLVSPEGCWVELNVAPLAADNPPQELLDKRVKREMWRALAYGMGVGNEQMGSLLNHITSVKELDANEYNEPTPDAFNHIIYSAAKRKMARVRYTSYRQACREGWAPAPTNDAQRAVLEQIKADKERGPTNPITIQPPKK